MGRSRSVDPLFSLTPLPHPAINLGRSEKSPGAFRPRPKPRLRSMAPRPLYDPSSGPMRYTGPQSSGSGTNYEKIRERNPRVEPRGF